MHLNDNSRNGRETPPFQSLAAPTRAYADIVA
jgi:hypothetical protein